MKIGIVGGKLQGVEAAYLAGKAGWETTVIDRLPDPPASGLCRRSIRVDITSQTDLRRILQPFDLVLPALENRKVLSYLRKHAHQDGPTILFDFDAFELSASKMESNRLFEAMNIPMPASYIDGTFPVIVKPSHGSGSKGVVIIHDAKSLRAHLATISGACVVQNFVQGPSYSLEIVGMPGNYQPLQVTELEMDAHFDCKRVMAPSGLPRDIGLKFEKMAFILAEALGLKGLMDIEVILDGEVLRILEIDARLPSQTPISVYASTGFNMLKALADSFMDPANHGCIVDMPQKGVVFEHIHVCHNKLTVMGEHIMSSQGVLHLKRRFFGADEAITNYAVGQEEWVATLIITAENRDSALQKRERVIGDIMKFFHLDTYDDSHP